MVKYTFAIPKFTQAGLISRGGGLTSGISLGLVIFPGTNKSFMVTEIDIEGMGTSSADAEFGIFRTITTAAAGALTTVITGQANILVATPPAFTGSAGQGSFATTQPTLGSAPIKTLRANANGQRYFWRANPNLDNALDYSGTPTALLGGFVLAQIGGTGVIAYSGEITVSEI